jgi:hypothetical protein
MPAVGKGDNQYTEDAVVMTRSRRFRSMVAAYPALADRVMLLRDIVLA